jgi:iron(III) transport system substrate-binding protein
MDKEILAGKYPISMSDLDYRVNENIIAGTPLTGIWPKDGVSVSPGPVAIIKETPHPNAAKLFYNYFLSSEGCQAFQKGGSSNAARKSGIIKWEHMPSLDELNIIDIDYRQLDKDEKDLLAKFEQVFGGAKKKAKSK